MSTQERITVLLGGMEIQCIAIHFTWEVYSRKMYELKFDVPPSKLPLLHTIQNLFEQNSRPLHLTIINHINRSAIEDDILLESYDLVSYGMANPECVLKLVSIDDLPRVPVMSVKRTELDEKYPHKCYYCRREIFYAHAYENYIKEIGILHPPEVKKENFRKIWKSKHVQFLCCLCYESKELINIENNGS